MSHKKISQFLILYVKYLQNQQILHDDDEKRVARCLSVQFKTKRCSQFFCQNQSLTFGDQNKSTCWCAAVKKIVLTFCSLTKKRNLSRIIGGNYKKKQVIILRTINLHETQSNKMSQGKVVQKQ